MRRALPLVAAVLVAGCSVPSASTTTATSAPVKSTTAAVKAAAPGLGADQGWVLLSFTPHISSGILSADARVRNDSDDENAVVDVSFVDSTGEVTHHFVGPINSLAHGRTATVVMFASTGKSLPPKGAKPEFRVTAAF